MTEQQFNEILRRPSIAKVNQAGGGPSSTIVECVAGDGSLAAPQIETSNTGKFVVRVTSYRTRLLDEDNLAEKFHVDACRYAGLIPSDAPDQTTIQVGQVKVKKKTECRTEIEIERIG